MTYDEFRRELLGLVDPEQKQGTAEKVAVKDAAIRFCAILAHLFGEQLDRLTLWSRIDSAFTTAVAKVSDDDLDRLADLCLEHVQAAPGMAAACDALAALRADFGVWPPELRHGFISYLRTHRYAVLTHGRARWEQVKKGTVEL